MRERNDLVLAVLIIVILVCVVERKVATVEGFRRRVGQETRAVAATLDGGLDAGEDALGAKEVDTAVDQVADVALGLLDVVQNALGVGIADNATKVCGSFVRHAGSQNDGLGILLFKQTQHLAQREGAADIGVEDEEAIGAALEDGITEVVETTSRA